VRRRIGDYIQGRVSRRIGENEPGRWEDRSRDYNKEPIRLWVRDSRENDCEGGIGDYILDQVGGRIGKNGPAVGRVE
jgi:hypothetical protein